MFTISKRGTITRNVIYGDDNNGRDLSSLVKAHKTNFFLEIPNTIGEKINPSTLEMHGFCTSSQPLWCLAVVQQQQRSKSRGILCKL